MEKSKKSRKAQVTLFVVIAILLVAATAIVLSMRGVKEKPPSEAPTEIAPIQTLIQGCIEENFLKGLYFISLQGGYLEIPSPSVEYHGVEMAYFYYENRKVMPTEEEVALELSKYMDLVLPQCVEGMSVPGFEIWAGEVKTKTIITDSKVAIDIHYPITIIKGDSTYRLSEFGTQSPKKLRLLYKTSKEIVDNYIEPSICLTCLAEIGEKDNIKVNMLNYGGIETIFTLVENSTGEPYAFTFAIT